MISAFRSSAFQISGSAISSHRNIQGTPTVLNDLMNNKVYTNYNKEEIDLTIKRICVIITIYNKDDYKA
jgi:hypothetical protein